MYLFTSMKSPISSVGSMEPEGILNGSTRKERSRKTIRMTGKKLTGYSIHHGTRASEARLLRSQKRSIAVMTPVKTSSKNKNRAKFMRSVRDAHAVSRAHHLRVLDCSCHYFSPTCRIARNAS